MISREKDGPWDTVWDAGNGRGIHIPLEDIEKNLSAGEKNKSYLTC